MTPFQPPPAESLVAPGTIVMLRIVSHFMRTQEVGEAPAPFRAQADYFFPGGR